MFQKAFEPSYTSFDSTGASFITQHTRVKLVGIDYLSIGCLEDIVETHRVLLGQVRLTNWLRLRTTSNTGDGQTTEDSRVCWPCEEALHWQCCSHRQHRPGLNARRQLEAF